MPDVSLTFRGQDVGAVQTTKSVEDALDALAQQALATSAVIREALDGVNGDPAQREIEKVNDELRETQEEARETQAALGLLAGAAGFGGLVISAQLVASALGDIKMPALFAAIGPGLALLGDLAAELYAVGAALAPLAGGFLAMPAAIGAMLAAMVTLKLGLNGVGEALKFADGDAKKFQAALEELTPAAREFALTYKNDLLPQIEALRDVAQENIFRGINEGLALASNDANWGALRGLVEDMSLVWGDFFRQLGAELADPQWAADLKTIGEQSATFMGLLLDALRGLLPVFRDLSVAAGPFLEDLGQLAVRLSDWATEAVAGARESGALADQFDRVSETAGLVWDILNPLVQVLYDVGVVAAPLGRQILRDLGDSLQKIADFTGSAGGTNALQDYFETAKPVIMEVNGLIGDLLEGLGRLAINPEFQEMLEDLISRLRIEVLPLFLEVAEQTALAFGPALTDALINILRLFADLSGSNGPLVELVEMISAIAGFFADMLEAHPVLQEVVFTLGGILTWAKLMAATGITTFITSLVSSMLLLTTATEGATVSALGLNAALRANPVGLVVTAIQALGIALYIAYTQSEDFRQVVDALGKTLLEVWDFLNRFHGVLLLMIPVLGPTIFFFKNLEEIIAAVSRVIDDSIVAWNRLVNVVTTVRDAFVAVVDFMRNFRDNFRQAAENAGDAIYDGIKAGLTGIVTEVETFLNRIVTELRNRVAAWTTAGRNLGRAIYNGIVNAVDDTVGRVRTLIGNVITAVTGFAGRALTAGRSIGTAIFNGVRNTLQGLGTTVSALMRGVINSALRAINYAIGRINSTLEFTISLPFAPDVHFDPRDIPTIPYLAAGGIVTGPTLAMLGDNPSGREAVIPLPERGDLMGGGGGVTIHVAGSVIQERDLARTIRDAVSQATRRDSGFMGGGLAAVPR